MNDKAFKPDTTDRPGRPDKRLVEVARYPFLSRANECLLAVIALGIGCWVFQRDGAFALLVEPAHEAVARAELERFETETRHAPTPPPPPPPPAAASGPLNLFLFGWIAAAFLIIQEKAPAWWQTNGAAASEAIVGGDWWRAVTALTLHGDLAHFIANLATGLLFLAFLLPLVGGGLAWIGFVATGAAGNALNAWGYRGEPHVSIGASTAIFGLLGILVASQFAACFSGRRPRLWQVVLPLGAGLALLALLGTGGGPGPDGSPRAATDHTDVMAHLWGFLAGLAYGGLVAASGLPTRLGPLAQRLLATAAATLVALAWWTAASHG